MNGAMTPSLPNAVSEEIGPESEEVPPLTADQQAELLRLARAAIAAYLEGGRILAYETSDQAFHRQAGVFVTLWTLAPNDNVGAGHPEPYERAASRLRLRGCMGHTPADLPLCIAVQQVAVTTATADPRVWPLRREELPHTLIEISVLSTLRRLTDITQLQIGRHGLLIVRDLRRGLLLPDVASRSGWDRLEFLENVCLKAGLPPDSWPEAELYTFTTEKFGETPDADTP